jgi:hypothetical protein
MSQNSNEPRESLAPGVRESNAVAARSIVPQPSDIPREGLSARPLVLITRGRIEYTAKCPGCANWHRHRHLGDVKGPCGTAYELQPRRGGDRGGATDRRSA